MTLPEKQRKRKTLCVTFLALMMPLSLTACNPRNSEVAVKIVCPEIRKYDDKTMDKALAEYKALPEGSAIRLMIGDYKQLRDQVRVCRAG